MSIFRTIAMFLYLFGYMIVHYGTLRRAERALAAGGPAPSSPPTAPCAGLIGLRIRGPPRRWSSWSTVTSPAGAAAS